MVWDTEPFTIHIPVHTHTHTYTVHWNACECSHISHSIHTHPHTCLYSPGEHVLPGCEGNLIAWEPKLSQSPDMLRGANSGGNSGATGWQPGWAEQLGCWGTLGPRGQAHERYIKVFFFFCLFGLCFCSLGVCICNLTPILSLSLCVADGCAYVCVCVCAVKLVCGCIIHLSILLVVLTLAALKSFHVLMQKHQRCVAMLLSF